MFIFYIMLIFLCLTVSFVNQTARQRYLWIYFSLVSTSELLIHYEILDRKFYDHLNVIYIVFFLIYYFRELKRMLRNFGWIILLLMCILLPFLGKEKLSIFQVFSYILLSIMWFYNEIKKPNEIAIYKKMTFWISASLLLWSVTFFMRIVPAHFFEKEDLDFLKNTIGKIYQIIVIISYIIFLRGLVCKQ